MEQNFFNFENPFEEGITPQEERKGISKKSKPAVEKIQEETPAEEPHIYTVSEITNSIRDLLEVQYPDVWVSGEVSNLRNPAARNYYFVLKDETCQIRTVIFGGRKKINFDLEDGLEVVCHGRVTVYNARGEYQIIVDYCEPKGKGALQIAFEQLKKKLEVEGLFAAERKRQIPFLPRKVGVITSPTGAAVRDIINVLTRRFPTIEILLIPVKVQGDGSAAEIARAINQMNELSDIDVMIVGRGGGSFEDLWAFNEEVVARAIYASRIPVVSAVGHQIDFTIADFVADVRAPTPSAAAELVVPEMLELSENIKDYRRQLGLAIKQALQTRWAEVQRFGGQLGDPTRRFPDLYMRLDGLNDHLKFVLDAKFKGYWQHLSKLESNLTHLSPMHILEKGYAVVSAKGTKNSIKSAKSLKQGQAVEVRFHQGSVEAEVTKRIDE